MPGPGYENPGKNIKRLREKGYPQQQAIAIGLREAGVPPKKKSK